MVDTGYMGSENETVAGSSIEYPSLDSLKESVSELYETVRDEIKGQYIARIGNRVTAGSWLTSLGGVASILAGNVDAGAPMMMYGSILTIATENGNGTRDIYERTKEHIEEYGELGESFADEVIGMYDDNPVVGYCQEQGMYLAAKELDELDAFYDVMEDSPRIIPNF